MNATELATLSMSELKFMCASHAAISVTGDRRAKLTYINAIETFQSQHTVTEIDSLPAIPDVLSVIDRSDNTTTLPQPTAQPPAPQPTPQPPTPTQRQAAIVMLAPLILLSVAVIAIRIGISALIPLIGSLMRFTGSIWQSIPRTNAQAHPLMVVDPSSIPIDYFPAFPPISA